MADSTTADSTNPQRFPLETLQTALEQILVRNSLFQFDARTVSRRLIEADLYGVPAHGCSRFGELMQSIELGDIDPRGRVLTLTDSPALAVLDGSRAAGAVAATKACDAAVQKARETGLAAVVVGNSQSLGSAGLYARIMAGEGMIGICTSSTGGASIAAPGTRSGAVGNSPFAYALPVQDSHPVVFDAACGMESWSGLRYLQRLGLPVSVEELWTRSRGSASSLDEAAVMPPRGGALGFGLSLLCSTLSGLLAGGRLPIHKTRREAAEDSQHFLLAIRIEAFCDRERFQKELTSTLNEIRQLPPIDGNAPVRIPGDREAAAAEENNRLGIPLPQFVVEELSRLAKKNKVEFPAPKA